MPAPRLPDRSRVAAYAKDGIVHQDLIGFDPEPEGDHQAFAAPFV
jgi:hypothetical protein